MNNIINIMIWAVMALPLSIWSDRNLEYALNYLKGEIIDIPFWISFIITFITGFLVIGVNVICELIRFFV